MADEGDSAGEQKITFNVKSSSDAKYVLTLPIATTVGDLKSKLSAAEYADVPPERQRLIYSGRVLKDNDTLADHKVKEGNTIHLVKSAASNQRQNPANQGSSSASASPAAAGVPTNLAAGTGNNPLAGLTGARYAGFTGLPGAGMFGPDGGMGPPPDPEQITSMLENPMFVSQMNEALQNPAAIEMMINSNPAFRNVPGIREFLQSDMFRRMVTDPNTYRQMSQMSRMFGGMPGMGGMGGGQNAFPAPGATNTTPADQARSTDGAATGAGASATPSQTNTTGSPPPNPFANPFGANPFAMFGNPGAGTGAGPAGNPFAALFGNPSAGHTPAQSPPPSSAGGTQQGTPQPQAGAPNPFSMFFNPAMMGQQPQQQQAAQPTGANPANASSPTPEQQPQQPFNPFQNNPFLNNPDAMQQMLAALGGGAPGATGGAGAFNPFAAFGGGSPEPPQDTRPPEERYAEQLRQLNDMGFYEFERNVEALRRTGGSVQGAVEYLLTH